MWVFTDYGFFSIVRDAQRDGHLLVRSRVRRDLELLRVRIADATGLDPATLEVRCTPDNDYRYRISVPREELAVVLSEAALELDYTNFKGQVAKTQGSGRAHRYHDVWAALLPLQDAEDRREGRAAPHDEWHGLPRGEEVIAGVVDRRDGTGVALVKPKPKGRR